jgi:dolichyl-diphosphooligosaccharide--protein glycosyltransferase
VKKHWPLLVLGAALVLGLVARMSTIRDVFGGAIPHAFSEDDHYHLRRVYFALRNPGHALDFDPFMSFPHGAWSWFPNGFDRLLTILVRLTAGPLATMAEAVAACSLAIPLFSIAALPLAYLLGRRLHGRAEGALAALVLAVLPAHAFAGLAGVVDHHCVETVLSLAPLLLLAAALDAVTTRRAALLGALSGAAVGFTLFFWSGAPLLTVVIIAAAGLATLGGKGPRLPALLGFAAALVPATWLAVRAAPLGQRGEYVTFIVSRFHLVFALALSVELLLFCAGALRARGRPGLHLLLFLGTNVVIVPLVALTAGLRPSHLDDTTAFVRSAGIVAWIEETAPLYSQWNAASYHFSPLLFVLPVWQSWETWRAFRTRDECAGSPPALPLASLAQGGSAGRSALHTAGLLFLVLSFLQFRHKVHWAPFAAVSLVHLFFTLRRRLPKGRAATLALVLAALVAAWRPLVWMRDVTLNRAGSAATLDACDFIRTRTPRAADPYAPGAKPAYSVLGAWDVGKTIAGVGERPSLGSADAYGPQLAGVLDLMRFFTTSDPAEASRLLDAYRVRYLLLPPQSVKHWEASIGMLGLPRERFFTPAGLLTDGAITSAYYRLWRFDGVALANANTRLPALRELRLVHESWADQEASPSKVFERVPGVLLTATLAPNAPVRLESPQRTDSGRRFVYRDFTTTAADGTLRLRFPYTGRVQVCSPAGCLSALVRDSDSGRDLPLR